jgi:hypothetical protein
MLEAIAFLSIVWALAGQGPASGQSGGTMDASRRQRDLRRERLSFAEPVGNMFSNARS